MGGGGSTGPGSTPEWISAFVHSLQRIEGTGVERKQHRQTVVNQLSCGFNPSLSQTFFRFLDLLRARFFLLITVV